MEEKEFQELFRKKIHLELGDFEHDMLKKEAEDVHYNAYRIECMNDIFECLCEMSRKMEVPVVKELLVFPSLLTFLCEQWIKREDSHMEEIRACVGQEITDLCKKHVVCE